MAGLAWGLLEMWGWRVLAALTAIPVCISLLWAIWVMPESPRWLVLKGRTDEAEAVLRTAAAINGTRLAPFKLRPVQAVDNGEKGVTVSDFVGADVRAVTFPLFLVWFLFGLTYYGMCFGSVYFLHYFFSIDLLIIMYICYRICRYYFLGGSNIREGQRGRKQLRLRL